MKSSPRCYKCGGSPHPKRECPANNAKCHSCGKNGHYQRVCGQSKLLIRVVFLHSKS
uniref:CCHC-type domain-containing protein n=1 Tax=Amphiprion ocellaris TaxID=80972 RepID=A0AAQ5ZAX8_AMPOC